MEFDVFAQIGLVMLIGLSAKNAILIVEFARARFERGGSLIDAALEGAKIRLRPILMTSLAFIFGCIPLWLASGAGAVARRVMGTAVIGGMLAASALAIFFIPVAFYAVEKNWPAGSAPETRWPQCTQFRQALVHLLPPIRLPPVRPDSCASLSHSVQCSPF